MRLEELRRALRAAEPNAMLVPPRVLRRVIKHDRKMTSLGLQVPHRLSYAIEATAALDVIEGYELGLEIEAEAALRGTLLLIAEPTPQELAELTRGQLLLKYWRLLFHAKVDQAIDERTHSGALTTADLRDRIAHIGPSAFEEAQSVLKAEEFLLPPRGPRDVYREFAAVFLELRQFVPALAPLYFPAITDPEQVEAVLAEDVDAEQLFEDTRLPNAPDPPAFEGLEASEAEEAEPAGPAWGTCPLPMLTFGRGAVESLSRRARRAADRGNFVRAAIHQARASRFLDPLGPPAEHDPWEGARSALDQLADRLAAALELGPEAARAWREALPALLAPTSEGVWAVETRLLFDLQKLCVDSERPIYTIDLVEWMLSRGKRPIKRLLPFQRQVLAVKHLRSAHWRIRKARVAEPERRRLDGLIASALERAKERLRDACREPIAETLRETGLEPRTVVEHVSFDKIVEELLDMIATRGFLTMGDLRDAIARNQVKLSDLSGAREFLRGDRLLDANRRMAEALDGIYRRGEIYLRWLQRFSSLGFGTPAGRFLTQYVVIPFGGAFVVLFFFDHLLAAASGQLGYGAPPTGLDRMLQAVETATAEAAGESSGAGFGGVTASILESQKTAWLERAEQETGHGPEVGLHLIPKRPGPWAIVTFIAGSFLFGLIHAPWFRSRVVWLLRAVYDVAKSVLIDLPLWIIRQEPIRRLITTRAFQFLWRMLVKPLAPAAFVYVCARIVGAPPDRAVTTAATIFLVVGTFLNLKVGRDMEEIASDYLVHFWKVIHVNIIIALYQLIVDIFGQLLENVDRLLYTVDEWLRFRGGESRLSYVVKGVLGVFWFYATYAIRFIINLLVEPQINPIKHFPVVTVSHKILAPILILMIDPLSRALDNRELATWIWFLTQLLLPGVFGFLVWELKENWRLYRANRTRLLPKVLVGGHGESLPRLLKPGLHSGTLPQLYARLRRAGRRKSRGPGGEARMHRLFEQTHHVEEAVVAFVERELVALLARTRAWGGLAAEAHPLRLSTNRIQVAVRFPELAAEPLCLRFEHDSGWILAGAEPPSWFERLAEPRRLVLQAALAGLYQMGRVDLVRPKIETLLPPETRAYALEDTALTVWLGERYQTEAIYNLAGEGRLYAHIQGPKPHRPPPVLDASDLILSRSILTWERWAETWELERQGRLPPDPFVRPMALSPAAEPTEARA